MEANYFAEEGWAVVSSEQGRPVAPKAEAQPVALESDAAAQLEEPNTVPNDG